MYDDGQDYMHDAGHYIVADNWGLGTVYSDPQMALSEFPYNSLGSNILSKSQFNNIEMETNHLPVWTNNVIESSIAAGTPSIVIPIFIFINFQIPLLSFLLLGFLRHH